MSRTYYMVSRKKESTQPHTLRTELFITRKKEWNTNIVYEGSSSTGKSPSPLDTKGLTK